MVTEHTTVGKDQEASSVMPTSIAMQATREKMKIINKIKNISNKGAGIDVIEVTNHFMVEFKDCSTGRNTCLILQI